jgi:hypothetical protein
MADTKLLFEAVQKLGKSKINVSVTCQMRDDEGYCVCVLTKSISPAPDSEWFPIKKSTFKVVMSSDEDYLAWGDAAEAFNLAGIDMKQIINDVYC